MASPLHPDMQAILDRRNALDIPPFAEGTPQGARAAFTAGQAALPRDRGARVRQIEGGTVEGPRGAIPIRRYRPDITAVRARMIYCHGGGWVFGTLDAFDPVCSSLAHTAGVEVVSVDYGLAPENGFPGPLDDAWAVLCAEAEPGLPLIVAGDSAGGNLAAALALRARDEGGPDIALQLLLYPVLDDDFTRPSYQAFGTGEHLISAADMAWFWDQHVAPQHRRNPYAAPLHAPSLAGLPEAIIVLAGCDPLHDEGAAYADALRAAGVTVTLRDHPDMAHGFFTLIGLLSRADEEVQAVGRIIADRLG